MNLKSLVCAFAGGILALGTAAASADVVYTFDATDVAAFGSAPYGTVTLVQNGADIDVTVSLRSDLDFVLTGGPHSVFSFNAANTSIGDIKNIVFASGPSGPANVIVLAPGANTPFGTFSFMIDCVDNKACGGQGGSNPIVDPLTFTVMNAVYSDFGVENDAGASFAADVICRSGRCNGATGAVGVTGPGEETGNLVVPEPATAALLGLGLLSVAAARRRRRD
ncbi:MAG: PEP-CTERM sorting domain-containing protein [Burkholderiaceae bacterium]|nr:PEP-CTERM sorting domain-containing protein [Burkholderiaceae bacterium]